MIFCQFSGCDSVRDISNGLNSASGNHNFTLAASSIAALYKALMDIYLIKHKADNSLHIEGTGSEVVFNVIVPVNTAQNGRYASNDNYDIQEDEIEED